MTLRMLTDQSEIAAAVRRRVCFLVRGLDGGGAQRDAILLANELQRQGVPAAIVTLESTGALRPLVDEAVPIVDLGKSRKLRLAFGLGAISAVLKAKPLAFVSSEAAANVATILASRLLARCRSRIILREVASPLDAAANDPYWQNRLAYRLVPYAYRRAELVLTFTEGVRRDLIDAFDIPGHKVIALGTNAVITAHMRTRLEAAARAPESALVVSVGRLSPEKDHVTLISAFALLLRRLPDARLVIVGEGRERRRLEALIVQLGLADAVTLAGHLDDPFPLLLRASLFVSSSRHEGFGNAIVEAMAVGVPVVATDAPHGPRDILEGGRHGRLVAVGDADALSSAMADTLAEAPDSAALRERAGAFTVEAAAEAIVRILRLAPGAGRPHAVEVL